MPSVCFANYVPNTSTLLMFSHIRLPCTACTIPNTLMSSNVTGSTTGLQAGYVPTQRQLDLIRDVSIQLGENFAAQVMLCTSAEATRDVIGNLLHQVQARRAPDAPRTPGQVAALHALKATPAEMEQAGTKERASALIDTLKARRAAEAPPPPTKPQVTQLQIEGAPGFCGHH